MKQLILAAILAFVGNAMAEVSMPTETPKEVKKVHKLKTINVAELETMLKTAKDNVVIFDANNDQTRKKEGVIPGSKILPKVNDYDIALLPTTKSTNLVFYCANEMCTASHDAAKVAIKAGYTNVRVLAPGIKGWKDSGKTTETYTN